jgi:hypothetical protein
MRLLASALLLALTLFHGETAAAADQYGPAGGRGAEATPPAAYPLLLPPCRDSFWGALLLHCVPRENVIVPYDDLYAQNQIRGLRPAQRKPYIQVFSW